MKLTKLNELIEDGEVVKGCWEITPDHEVQYKKNGADEEIKVNGSLVAAEPGALVIGVTERQTNQTIVTSIYRLTGAWKADPKNQLTFEVAREQGKNDVLTFRARWRINSRHEIVYTYDRIDLKTKRKTAQDLNFQGYWDISEKNRLTYFVGGDSESAFRFRGRFKREAFSPSAGRYAINWVRRHPASIRSK